ncbi:MAG: hypothetical protein MEQ07_07350 [Aquimonas sp.]|nr:hypothetical protein [Aquimonas sp.]
MSRISLPIAIITALLAFNTALPVQARNVDPARVSAQSDPRYLASHPDQHHRSLGLTALEQQQPRAALRHFLRAARHADKASQAVIAEMYFHGQGVPQDRARGYAWMDLAAERGYLGFAALREQYWRQLGDIEQARALDIGRQLYAEYEDDVAKPRLEALLRQGRRDRTGSRVGYVGSLRILDAQDQIGMRLRLVQGSSGPSFGGDAYHAAELWEPSKYWAAQDRLWNRPVQSLVEILPLRAATD